MAETPSDLFGDLHIQLRRDMTGGNLIVDRDCTIKGNLTVEGGGGGGGGGGDTDWSKMPTATTEKVGGIVVGNGFTVVVKGGVTPGKVVGQLDVDFAVPTVLPSQAAPGRYDETDDAHAATPKAAYSIAYWTAIQLINAKITSVINGEGPQPTGGDLLPDSDAVSEYVTAKINELELELGDAAKKDLAQSIGVGQTGLVSGAQVYLYIDGLNLGNTYAGKSHMHPLSEIYWGGNATFNHGTTISANSTNSDLATGKAVYDYAAPKSHEHTLSQITDAGTAAGLDTGNGAGNIPILDGAGKLSISMMPERVIGGEYLGEVADQAAMIAKSNATVGDFVKRTDTGTYWMLGINSDGAYATAANWFEYAGAVASVNGATGQVTQAQLGMVTTINSSSDTTFPSCKCVTGYVSAQINNLSLPLTYAKLGHTHTLDKIIYSGTTGYGAGTTIASNSTDGQLATAKAVYTFVTNQISGLNLAATYAPISHGHAASEITSGTLAAARLPNATASAKGAVIVGTGLTVNNGTISLATASTSSYGGVIVGSGLSVSGGTVSIAAATSTALGGVKVGTGNGLTFNSNKIEITLANGTSAGTVKQGNGVTISSGTISAKVDGVSVIIDGSGQIGVDDNYVNQVFDNIGALKETTARESYLKQAATGITAWNNGKSYAIGDKVLNRGEIYRATAANQSKEPYAYYVGVTAVWEKITLDAANRFETVITGTGAVKMFTVTHNLGVKDCDVTVIDDESDCKVLTGVRYDSTNEVTIGFAENVALNKKFRVVIRK